MSSLHSALLSHPLLSSLGPEAQAYVVAHARPIQCTPGQPIIIENQDGPEAYFLTQGEVAILTEGKFVTLLRAPDIVGLVSALDGQPRSASVSAFRDAQLFAIKKSTIEDLLSNNPPFARQLISHLTEKLREQYTRESKLLSHLDDFFESPGALLIPGPYAADAFEMFVVVMQDESARVSSLLPPGLQPLPGLDGKYLLVFSFFPNMYTQHSAGAGKSFAYNETAFFVPCKGPSLIPGLFCPELYPDNTLAISIGRELYGFPKRFGATLRADDHIDFVAGRKMILRASWNEQQPIAAGEATRNILRSLSNQLPFSSLWAQMGAWATQVAQAPAVLARCPRTPVYVRKRIPDCASKPDARAYIIDQLVEVPFCITEFGEHFALDALHIEHFTPDHFLRGQALCGIRLKVTFQFDEAHVWRDYRNPPASSNMRTRMRHKLGLRRT